MAEQRATHGHASHDAEQRRLKARKIVRILESERALRGARVLEIGTGSGVIADVLAESVGPEGRLVSVDVVDQRDVRGEYEFARVSDARLPFPDASFDVVVSNLVIEHVGPWPEQVIHLAEIRRVLRADGCGYIAAPNRWALIEPHFRLPLLGWLPRAMADAYVRAAGRANAYDCFPVRPFRLRAAMRDCGLAWRSKAGLAVRLMAELETRRLPRLAAALMPAGAVDAMSAFLPTMIFVVRRTA